MTWGERDAGPCPKCTNPSWFEVVNEDLVQRCLCGLHKIVRSYDEDGRYSIHRVRPRDVVVPSEETKIGRCLRIVFQAHPDPVGTGTVAVAIRMTVDVVSQHMMLLYQRGLVERVENHRAKTGGSTWTLSHRAFQLMGGIKKRRPDGRRI